MRHRSESTGVDGPGDRPQEAQTVLQVPDAGAGEGVPLQRVRLQAEALGTGAQSEPHRTPGQNMVPKQADEEQEEFTATSRPAAKQQQRDDEQPEPPSSRHTPRPQSAPRGRAESPRGGQRHQPHQTSPVTRSILWSRVRSSPPWTRHLSRRRRVQQHPHYHHRIGRKSTRFSLWFLMRSVYKLMTCHS